MWDLLGQIGYQVSRAGNAAQNVFGGGVSTDPNDFTALGVDKDYAYANDPKAQSAYEQALRDGQVLVDRGLRSPQENESAARAAADRWLNDPLRFVTEPLDNFLTGNPVGRAVAPAVEQGAGWSSASGGHAGMAAPATRAGDLDTARIVDNAAQEYHRNQPSPVPLRSTRRRASGMVGTG